MTPEEEKRAKAAAKKRAYRLRKKQEDLARQAPKEEQERLFYEQFRNPTPEEIEAIKRDEQARMQDFRRIAQATPNPLSKEQKEQALQQILAEHPELEEQLRKAQGNSEIRPLHPLADEPALLADTILNSYSKDFCNTNALLKHILAHRIRIEITLQDRLK